MPSSKKNIIEDIVPPDESWDIDSKENQEQLQENKIVQDFSTRDYNSDGIITPDEQLDTKNFDGIKKQIEQKRKSKNNNNNNYKKYVFQEKHKVASPWGHHPLRYIIFGVIFIIGVVLIITVPKGQALVSVFYPSSCLGGWENTQNAIGEPEALFSLNPEDYTSGNSAFTNGLAEMYCGDFKGSIPPATLPTSFELAISWSVDDGSVNHIAPQPFDIQELNTTDAKESDIIEETSNAEGVESIDQGVATNTEIEESSDAGISSGTEGASENSNEVVPDLDTTPNTEGVENSNEETQTGIQAFLRMLIMPISVFAEDVLSDDPSVLPDGEQIQDEELTTEENDIEITTDESSILPEAELTAEETGTEITTEDSSDVLPETELITQEAETITDVSDISDDVVNDPFISIYYTLDGELWNILATVERDEWQNVRIPIPLNNWEQISKLQLRFVTVSRIDPLPHVYIDAVALNVLYSEDVSLALVPDGSADFKKYTIEDFQDEHSGSFSVDVKNNSDQGEFLHIISSNGGAYVIYPHEETAESVMMSSIGTDPVDVFSYQLSLGSYVMLATKRLDGCEQLNLRRCRDDADYGGEITFSIAPSLNTPLAYRDEGIKDESIIAGEEPQISNEAAISMPVLVSDLNTSSDVILSETLGGDALVEIEISDDVTPIGDVVADIISDIIPDSTLESVEETSVDEETNISSDEELDTAEDVVISSDGEI